MEPPTKKRRKTEENSSIESKFRSLILKDWYPLSPMFIIGNKKPMKRSYSLYTAWALIGLAKYDDYMQLTSSSDFENSLYRKCRSKHEQGKELIMIDTSNYMKRLVATLLPGPPHWEGAEGGCLGLPKDVAKMILKWL